MYTVLVVGASGVIGDAAVMRFAASPGWSVIALSRRKPFGAAHHVAIDLADAAACRNVCQDLKAVTHVVYAALAEKPGLVEGWRDPGQMDLNLRMLRNLLEPLSQAAGLSHVTLLQGAKAYGGHVGHLAPMPARENAPRDAHENFYWLQEDCLRDLATAAGFAWTIFRPAIVVGAAWGAAMNPLLPLGAYAALRREEGRPLSYPGGPMKITEIVGADLLAEAFEWAATHPAAKDETFNITNGDLFAWTDAWPAIAEALGAERGPDDPMSLVDYFAERGEAWDRIVRRESLEPLALPQFLGESHHYLDLLLRGGVSSRPTLLSTIKLRQAGFGACRDSEESVRRWIAELKARRLIP
jgi:nucleoside-diphosphate-sugar epimerase